MRDMPQPLSRKKADAKVILWPAVHDHIIHQIVSVIFATSSRIDHEVSLLLVRILGAEALPALAMFDVAAKQRMQQQLVAAAAEARFGKDSEQYRVFKAVTSVAETAQSDRNKLAHWIWGHSPDMPHTLLLADPKKLRNREID